MANKLKTDTYTWSGNVTEKYTKIDYVVPESLVMISISNNTDEHLFFRFGKNKYGKDVYSTKKIHFMVESKKTLLGDLTPFTTGKNQRLYLTGKPTNGSVDFLFMTKF